MPELVLPSPRPPAPAPVLVRSRRWGRRRTEVAAAYSDAFWQDVHAHPGEPVEGGGTALLLCDLGPGADPDLVGLADRLLLPGSSPRANGYVVVVPVLVGSRDEEVHPLLRERTSAYACRFDRASDGMRPRPAVADALLATVNAKDSIIDVARWLRTHRCGAVHLVAADPLVRETTLDHLRERGWPVDLPRPV